MKDDYANLEPGLCFFFENQKEFERKDVPVEKQVALGYAAGVEAGKCELRKKVAQDFKFSNIEWAKP